MVIIIPHGFEPNYTLGFVKGLTANGVKVIVVSSDIDNPLLNKVSICNVNLRGSQDPHRPLMKKVLNLLRYYFSLVVFLLKNKRQVIHFTGLFGNHILLIDGFFLNIYLKIISRRYIYTVHNLVPHGKENSLLYRWTYRFVYKIPDILVAHTEEVKRQLIESFSVPQEKVIVMSIGLNEEVPVTDISREEARERLGINEKENVVLFFGKADKYKGLDILIDAFATLKRSSKKLLISAWFTSDSYRRKVLRAIETSGCKENILFFEGFLPNKDVGLFFKSADVLVLPYRKIYQSGVLFLALRFGLPIIATDAGSFRDYVKENIGIIAEKCSAQDISEAIEEFFMNSERFKRDMIKNEAKKYKWEEVCKALISHYR